MLHALLISIIESAIALGLIGFVVTALRLSAERRFQLWATVLLIALAGFSASWIASQRPATSNAASVEWTEERMGLAVHAGMTGTIQLPSSTPANHQISELASAGEAYGTWAGRIWLFGVLIYAIRISSSLLRLFRLRRDAMSARTPDPRISNLLSDLPREVRIVELAGATSPIFLGLGKPLIVLPERLPNAFSFDELRFIIAHELEHWRRRDDYVDLISRILTALLWPNPSVHLARRFMIIERECACDQAGSRVLRGGVEAAHCLWKSAQTLGLAPTPNAIAAFGSSSELVTRIRRLVTHQAQRELNSKILFAGIAPIVAMAVFVATLASPGTARPHVVQGQHSFGGLQHEATTMNDSQSAASKLESGENARREKRLPDARADFAAAADWYAVHGPAQMQVHALTRQAQIERDLSNYDAAVDFQESALRLQRTIGPDGLPHVLRHLADIMDDAGRYREASPYYAEMERIYRNSSATPPLEMANAIRSLAVHAEHVGDKEKAQQLWTEARDRYSKLDHQFLQLTGQPRNPGVEEAERRLALL